MFQQHKNGWFGVTYRQLGLGREVAPVGSVQKGLGGRNLKGAALAQWGLLAAQRLPGSVG